MSILIGRGVATSVAVKDVAVAILPPYYYISFFRKFDFRVSNETRCTEWICDNPLIRIINHDVCEFFNPSSCPIYRSPQLQKPTTLPCIPCSYAKFTPSSCTPCPVLVAHYLIVPNMRKEKTTRPALWCSIVELCTFIPSAHTLH